MIVRLMGEGQFRVADELRSKLNELDDKAQAAADANESPSSTESSTRCGVSSRATASGLPTTTCTPRTSSIPPSDLTLEETQRLFSDQGLIPDIPTA